MFKTFTLPDLGEGIHEGEIMAVTVSVGDLVTEGDVILEIETDKAAVEIPSPFTGIVTEILVGVGDLVKVGAPLITFDLDGDSVEETPTAQEKTAETPPQKTNQKEAETSRPVPASPATRRLARELGVSLNMVTPTGRGGVVTSEDVRNFSEKGIEELMQVAGTQEEFPEKESQTSSEPSETQEAASADDEAPQKSRSETARSITTELPPLPDFSKWGPVEKATVRSIRRATARQMSLSWSQIPHVTSTDTVDVTELEAFRQKHKQAIADKGGHLTLTVFVLKAAVTALKAFPRFNASLNAEAGEMILKKYYHIGVAVDTDDGLIVPVLRDVDRKSLTDISVELKETVQKTHDRKIAVENLQGGTFTITNMGRRGGGFFTPIINYPQAAILGMGRAQLQPVVKNNNAGRSEIVPRMMMPIVLTMDHRMLDGGDAARFLSVMIEALEDPEQLMLTMA